MTRNGSQKKSHYTDPSSSFWKTAKSWPWSNVSVVLILICVMGAPLIFALPRDLTTIALTIICLCALALHIVGRWQNHQVIHSSYLGLPIFLSGLFALLMITPLPASWRAFLSPDAFSKMQHTAQLLPTKWANEIRPVLSLDPPQTALHFLQFIAACCIFIIIADRARNKKIRLWIFYAFLIGGLALAITAVVHRFVRAELIWGLFETNTGIPLYAPMRNPNHLSRFFAVFSLMSLAGMYVVKERYTKLLFLFSAAICGMCVPLATSKGGTLVFALAITAVMILNQARWTWLLVAWSTLASLYIGEQAIFGELSGFTEGQSIETKVALYQLIPSILKHHWLVGIGHGSFDVDFFAHTIYVPDNLSTLFRYTYVENIVLQTLVDHGLIKGILLLLIALWVLVYLIKYSFDTPAMKITVVTLLLFLAGDLFDFAIEFSSGIWMVTLLLALCAAYQAEKSPLQLQLSIRPTLALLTSFVALTAWSQSFTYDVSNDLVKDPVAIRGVAHHPFDAYYALVLAQNARMQGNHTRALTWAKQANLLEPVRFEAHLELARDYFNLKHYARSLTEYRRAFEVRPVEGSTIVHEVALNFSTQNVRAQVLPDFSPEYFVFLCRELSRENRVSEAENCYEIVGGFEAVNYALNHSYIDRAKAMLALSLDGKKADGEAAVLETRITELQQNTQAAWQQSEMLIKQLKEPCSLLRWRVDAASSLHHLEQAQAELERLRQCSSDIISSFDIDHLQVRLWREAGEKGKALQTIKSLAQIQPEDMGIRKIEFDLEMELGQIDAATESLNEIRRFAPHDDSLKNLGDRLAEAQKQRERERIEGLIR